MEGGAGAAGGGLARRAADMLLSGATLAAEPCPYCGGVRVIKAGRALCASCGREPAAPAGGPAPAPGPEAAALAAIERKIAALGRELEAEADPARQAEILGSMEGLAAAAGRVRAAAGGGKQGF